MVDWFDFYTLKVIFQLQNLNKNILQYLDWFLIVRAAFLASNCSITSPVKISRWQELIEEGEVLNRQLFDLAEPKEWVRKKRLVFGILPATDEVASSMSPMVLVKFNSGHLKSFFELQKQELIWRSIAQWL